jgi:uncharacterized protein YjiS (DUF1127 family)
MTQHILAINNYLRSPIEGLLQFLKNLNRGYQQRKAIKRTINELHQLSDAELTDIGLSRGDIYSVAHGDKHHKKSARVNHNLKGWV